MRRTTGPLRYLNLPAILRASLVAPSLLLAATSLAQVQPAEGPPILEHPVAWNLFFGGNLERQSSQSLDGWDVAVANYPYKSHPWIGGAITGSGNYFSQPNSTISLYTLMGGPSVSATNRRVQPFAHALFGVVFIRNASTINNISSTITTRDIGITVGAGADIAIAGPFAIRGQGDWVEYWQQSTHLSALRRTAGIVFRF